MPPSTSQMRIRAAKQQLRTALLYNSRAIDSLLGFTMQKSRERDYTFDILKFIAIAIIVLHHYQQTTGAFFPTSVNWYDGRFYWGNLVELFFIISGYFTYTSISRIRNGDSFFRFYIKKYLRFLPMLFICGGVCLITQWCYIHTLDTSSGMNISFWNIIASLFGFQRWFDSNLMINNPMWYISVLLLCLIVFYGVTRICLSFNLSVFLGYGLMAVVGMIMRAITLKYGVDLPFFNNSIGRGLLCFFLGLCIAMIFKNKKLEKTLETSWTIFFGASVLILGFIVLYIVKPHLILGSSSDTLYYSLCFVVYPCLMILCNNASLKHCLSHLHLSFMGGFLIMPTHGMGQSCMPMYRSLPYAGSILANYPQCTLFS